MHPLKSKILDYCLSLPNTEESFPFDENVWVAKVYGKMFVLMNIPADTVSINVKCDPELAEELRAEHNFIRPGYHMSKKHWNTIYCSEEVLEWSFIEKWIDHSYDLVLKSIPKSKRV